MRLRHYLHQGMLIVYRRTETAVARRRPTFRRWTATTRERTDALATELGAAAASGARALLLRSHRSEAIEPPPPLVLGDHVFDVVADLADYTGLAPALVVELLQRRHESFRSEWHSLPPPLRDDHWYYLSSRTYLFANAIHLHEGGDALAAIESALGDASTVLDFGGGTGNLALALAAKGLGVTYTELSALQAGFARFRVAKHRLETGVEVVEWWRDLPRSRFDAIVAIDVFEHLPDVSETLVERLLPSLRPGGILVEASPFVRSLSNPMHHEGGEVLDETLLEHGCILERQIGSLRVWRSGHGDDG